MEVGDKKLLVMNVKGFLIDCYHVNNGDKRPKRRPDGKVNKFYVYRRPGCQEFVQFCLDNFTVGIWSSAYSHNVTALADFVFGKAANKLAFVWSKSQCTESGLYHPDNKEKPLVWKELSTIWNMERGLPWRKGTFGPSNTVLVDDDEYASERNPPNSAIILKTYRITDPDDKNLGKLRKYLEGLADAQNVQEYIEKSPFGELSDSVCESDDDLSLELLDALSINDKHDNSSTVSLSSSNLRNSEVVATTPRSVDEQKPGLVMEEVGVAARFEQKGKEHHDSDSLKEKESRQEAETSCQLGSRSDKPLVQSGKEREDSNPPTAKETREETEGTLGRDSLKAATGASSTGGK